MSQPIVVERLITAPPRVVYAYLTDAEKWARWQGDRATIRPERGGLFALSMANGTTARGEFVEVEQDRRVVFTWGWVDHPGVPPGSTTVEIELFEEGEGTRLRLTHTGLPPDEVAIHTVGWEHYSRRLVTAAEGGDPGTDALPD
jgi:uncharacterized protein YndB with AHSA1/START domain